MKNIGLKQRFGILLTILLSGSLFVSADTADDWDPITDVQKENFYIYIVFGQSNAEGYAARPLDEDKIPNKDLKNLIAYDNYENEDATGINDSHLGEWESVAEPNCRKCKHFQTAFSWVKTFGEEMLARNPGKKFGFIHVAVASAGIRLFDKALYATYMDGTQTNPSPDANAQKKAKYAYGGNPYQRIIEMAKIAQKYGTIKGILMHQGEADGWKSFWPSEVKKVYRDMLKDLSLKSSEIPLIFGEPTGGNGPIPNQDAIVTEGNAYYIPNCYKVKALDLPYIPNSKLHFTREGYVELGKRFAEKASELLVTTGIDGVSFSKGNIEVTIGKRSEGKFEIKSSVPLVKIRVFSLEGCCLANFDLNNLSSFIFSARLLTNKLVILEFVAANGAKKIVKYFDSTSCLVR
ncbi:sialate O-acetylesterase [Prevotella sp. KH2C16]|uniref:sialate O-acetylesterase n=1 Tax=Prevotella sp. KH2C16 TaxID=1855325 RepID=UPI0008E14ED9|nr:sialate O-acetylesterase [Prevotella sp. KH2C16]SFG47326.1 hypothetical protein SAMN05216383_1163 [Prevotella sp. KH2C16]